MFALLDSTSEVDGLGLGRGPHAAGPPRPTPRPTGPPRPLTGPPTGPPTGLPPGHGSGPVGHPFNTPQQATNASFMVQPGKNNNYTTADMESLDELLNKVCRQPLGDPLGDPWVTLEPEQKCPGQFPSELIAIQPRSALIGASFHFRASLTRKYACLLLFGSCDAARRGVAVGWNQVGLGAGLGAPFSPGEILFLCPVAILSGTGTGTRTRTRGPAVRSLLPFPPRPGLS